MAKTAPKKPTPKKNFDLDAFLKSQNLDKEPTDKPLSWIPLSKPWHDALKIPGFPRGYVSLVRGYSDTGKSTAFYEGIAGAQKIGDFPIIFETEGNWSWEHAKMCGVKHIEVVNKETGEITDKPDGFILYRGIDIFNEMKNYDHKEIKMKTTQTRLIPVIEDVSFLMMKYLKMQSDGEFPFNIAFFWDSIGTLDCFKSATSNSSNNMWNAGAMGIFQPIVNFMIPSSRDITSEYTNTFVSVQKIWLDNMNGSVIKHRGGEFMFFNSRIIVHVGGILTHGTKKLKAKALNQDYQYGTEVKIKCQKNHITGIERSGVIASTPHGFINPAEIDAYKKEHRKHIHDMLNVDYGTEIDFSTEEGKLSADDVSE
tara:strand:+ start:48264 stop:49367 length:1104 start_codon:yes stop_codon:yes gene_type:complete